MLFLLVAVGINANEPTPNRACTIYDNIDSRTTFSGSTCIEVLNSLFSGTTGTAGGALTISQGDTALYVQVCTFFDTSATATSNAYGGAIYHYGAVLEILFCCFDSTFATTHGTAIAIRTTGNTVGAKSVENSLFLNCQGGSGTTYGTVWFSTQTATEFDSANFTACTIPTSSSAAYSGFIFYATSGTVSVSWSFSSCTVLKCSGRNGIYNGRRYSRLFRTATSTIKRVQMQAVLSSGPLMLQKSVSAFSGITVGSWA
jgi:hypothetical protein